MDKYREFVELAAQEGEDKVFFNSGPNHAAIVMSRIFKYSSNTVKIYCGGFSGAVSNDEEYLKHLDSFLKKGGRLKVLVEKDMSAANPKIFHVLRKYPKNYEIYQTNLRVVGTDSRLPMHFAIGDNKMVRIETDTTDYTAQVNFGNAEHAAHLDATFEQIFAGQKTRITA